MITVLIALVLSIATQSAIGGGWGVFTGIIVFLATMIIVARLCQKRLMAVMGKYENSTAKFQAEAQKLQNRYQAKPVGSIKQMQAKIESIYEEGVLESIKVLDEAQPIYKWNLLAKKQIDTQKFAALFQVKRFEEADALMPKVLTLDISIYTMKFARQYMTEDPDFEKTFQKGIKRFKGEKGLLLYAIYTFAMVKRKQVDKAVEVLATAKELTDNDLIQRNWKALANNNVHLFSWGGLGEAWYGLHLEKPPRPKASKGQLKGHPMAGKGKRRYF